MDGYDQVLRYFTGPAGAALSSLGQHERAAAQEIRLRCGQPIVVKVSGQARFLEGQAGAYRVTCADLDNAFRCMCDYSVHAKQSEIQNGFLSLAGGHRAGICGRCVLEDGQVVSIRELSSITLRIAHQIRGCADRLIDRCFGGGVTSLLLAGPPSSGKTTLLRDIARRLSQGCCGKMYQVSVVDERGEIAGVWQGQPQNEMGACCDVLTGFPKKEGMQLAIRTLAPDVMICDEIGDNGDAMGIAQAANAGVRVIASVHGDTPGALLYRPQLRPLFSMRVFDQVAFLSGSDRPGTLRAVYPAAQLARGEAG